MDPDLNHELTSDITDVTPPAAPVPAPIPPTPPAKPDSTLGDGGMAALRAERAERRELQRRIYELEAQLNSTSHQQEIDRLEQERQRIEAEKQQLLATHQQELEQVKASLTEELTLTKTQLEQELSSHQQELRRQRVENVFLAAGGDGSFTREFQALLGDRLALSEGQVVVLDDDGQPLLVEVEGVGEAGRKAYRPLDPQDWLAEQRQSNPVVAALFPAPRQGYGGGMAPGQNGTVPNPTAALGQASALDKLRYGLGA